MNPPDRHPTLPIVELPTPAHGLHVCPCCAGDAVQPIEWHEASAEAWALTLRCPNCQWVGGGVFSQALVERLEDELDRGLDAVIRDLRRLQAANMEAELRRFASALAANAILPEDF